MHLGFTIIFLDPLSKANRNVSKSVQKQVGLTSQSCRTSNQVLTKAVAQRKHKVWEWLYGLETQVSTQRLEYKGINTVSPVSCLKRLFLAR